MSGFFDFLANLLTVFALHLSQSSFPKPLTATDERLYLERKERGDTAARDILIRHNLRLVAHIVKKYYASRMDQDDLVSIGTIGLIKAIDSYSLAKNIRFSSYASVCIENEILMTFRALKKEQRTVFLGDETTESGSSIVDLIPDESIDDQRMERHDLLRELRVLIPALPAREKEIITLRYGLGGAAPLTQDEVAVRLGISRSYVSRIEKSTLTRLRATLDAD